MGEREGVDHLASQRDPFGVYRSVAYALSLMTSATPVALEVTLSHFSPFGTLLFDSKFYTKKTPQVVVSFFLLVYVLLRLTAFAMPC